jgi:hypothetical protein
MSIFIELSEILKKCKKGESCFEIDKENNSINCLDKNNLISCNLKCGIFTDFTWQLVKNKIDYVVTKNFDIQLVNNKTD